MFRGVPNADSAPVGMKRKAQDLSEGSEDEVAEISSEQTSETSSGSSSAGSELEDSSSDSGSDDKGEVDVDFEFFDPQEIDFHGLKALLQTYLDGSSYSCSELVDTVIKQVYFSAPYKIYITSQLVWLVPDKAFADCAENCWDCCQND